MFFLAQSYDSFKPTECVCLLNNEIAADDMILSNVRLRITDLVKHKIVDVMFVIT